MEMYVPNENPNGNVGIKVGVGFIHFNDIYLYIFNF